MTQLAEQMKQFAINFFENEAEALEYIKELEFDFNEKENRLEISDNKFFRFDYTVKLNDENFELCSRRKNWEVINIEPISLYQ